MNNVNPEAAQPMEPPLAKLALHCWSLMTRTQKQQLRKAVSELSPMQTFTMCSGSKSFSVVMEVIWSTLGLESDGRWELVFACEKDEQKQKWISHLVDEKCHIFKDIGDMHTAAPHCVQHQRPCAIGEQLLHLGMTGFSCKDVSKLNTAPKPGLTLSVATCDKSHKQLIIMNQKDTN